MPLQRRAGARHGMAMANLQGEYADVLGCIKRLAGLEANGGA